MKKKRNVMPIFKLGTNEILLKMKLLTFMLFAAFVSASASSYSQGAKFNLNMKDVTISDVFQKIEAQSEFVILFNEKTLNIKRKVDVSVENETVDKVLDQIFKGDKDAYKIFDRQIAIYPNEINELSTFVKSETNTEQQKKELSGTIRDNKGLPLPGVTVHIKGSTVGTITDNEGKFKFSVPLDAKILVFSFVGMKTQEFPIATKSTFNAILSEEAVGLEEVVAVGYGVQKKASVLGAITTTTNKELQRTGNVPNLAMALTGNLPGVTTIQSSGQPGNDDPKIYIRGQSTWNGGQPYILVDGVERRMNDLDMSEVDNISILKDASATSVYGVKGANGVILITTKRGNTGKPTLTISANTTLKMPSKLVSKLDSYDMYRVKNESIEREVVLNESEWADYTDMTIVNRYRNQQNLKYPEAYPNIDWRKETIKDAAFDHRVNMNVSGGTDFVKYFSALSYLHEGDLLKVWDNNRGYKPGLGYDKFNFRTNLDINITKSTQLKINLAGVYGVMKDTYIYGSDYGDYQLMIGTYSTPPDAFMPRYSDGRWGINPSVNEYITNSVAGAATAGIRNTRKTDLTSDISLTQRLDFITKGLSANVNVSFDNHIESVGGLQDGSNSYVTNAATEWINPAIEDALPGEDLSKYYQINPVTGTNQFAWVRVPWTIIDENAVNSLGTLRRRLYYQGQVNYARTFGRHDVTATGVFTREQLATGSEFQHYREDWIARVTYNYDNRYFAEFNGAYNGSEKFGPGYKFGFFPSAAVGWTISNEHFMKNIEWLDKLKLRYTYGKIGDDGGTVGNTVNNRWLFDTQWGIGATANLKQYVTDNVPRSPYTNYYEAVLGNPSLHWETAIKSNLGLEVAVLKNMLSGSVDYFTEDRTGIFVSGTSRIIPIYFGTVSPAANVGHVTKKGYEVELRFNKNILDWHLWANTSMTHAVDKILSKEEPLLKDPHLLAAGFQIDQTKSLIRDGFYNNWNEVYASTPLTASDNAKLPGSYNLIDFDGNGVIDYTKDAAPYGYSNRPQNTYNFSLGADYKNFSIMLQFYGVNNVTRALNFANFVNNLNIAFSPVLDYWSPNNLDATSMLPRWKTISPAIGDIYLYDASYLRLKTAEVAYTFSGNHIKWSGISSLKVYLNGNNLFFWSKLPDDREEGNTANASDRYGAYPTARRINLGVDIKF